MIILKEGAKKEEAIQIKSSGWQRDVYRFLSQRIGDEFMDKVMKKVYPMIPDGTKSGEIKNVVIKSFIDYTNGILG